VAVGGAACPRSLAAAGGDGGGVSSRSPGPGCGPCDTGRPSRRRVPANPPVPSTTCAVFVSPWSC